MIITWRGKSIKGPPISFQPEVNQELVIGNVTYRVAVHPGAPGIPYGQEGRQAVVYQLVAQDGDAQALKVFKPRYRLPALVGQATKIAPLADLPGLQVCRRTVLSARRNRGLLRQHPDLTYAVLMPWVQGPTWLEVMIEKRELTPEQGLELARSLAEILATMEEHGLAHCDLSGPNVLLPSLAPSAVSDYGASIQLVDVEQLYSSDLKRPELLPGGSPGYAHKTAPDGLWGSTADRFAGAVLLGEMLGWCDERVREAGWGENYFEPQEMQRESARFQALLRVLRERWGDDVAGLFERAWRSEVLADCATFGEWLVTLPEEVPVVVSSSMPETKEAEEEVASEASEAAVRALMEVAQRLEEQGNPAGALENYRHAQTLVSAGSELAEELRLIVQDLEATHEKERTAISVAEEPELDSIFNDGLAAYQSEKWARAKELLAEVVRQQPGYERDGQKASRLLADVERRLAPARRRVPGWAWITGAGVLVLLVIGGWNLLFPSRTPVTGDTRMRSADGKMMVYVPAGAFLMGSDPAKDSSADDDEQPQHEVHLGAFWIDKTEVTTEEYEACVQANVCTPSAFADDPAYDHSGYPVLGVDWANARAYCQWVGGDLPTEAQWEKAARGADGRIYPWGDELDGTKANFCDVNCYLPHKVRSYDDGYEKTAPTRDFPDGASPYGALNMAGNVWEWVLDCYDSNFYGTTAATGNDPENDMVRCNTAVLRGGSWASSHRTIRSASRRGVNPSGKGHFVGFRCVFPAVSP